MPLFKKQINITDSLETVNSVAKRLNVSCQSIIRLVSTGELRGTIERPLMVNKDDVTARIRRMCKQAGIDI